jgi:hypothetical protein
VPDQCVGVAERLEPGAGEDGSIALFKRVPREVAVAGQVLQPMGAVAEPEQPPHLRPAEATEISGEVAGRSESINPARRGRLWSDIVDQDRDALWG